MTIALLPGEMRQATYVSSFIHTPPEGFGKIMAEVQLRLAVGYRTIRNPELDMQMIAAVGAKTLYIEPGSPWENGYCESFNARFRDELLDGETFYTLREAQILIERWRRHYNTVRPHSALGHRPPAPEVIFPIDQRPTMHQQSN